MIRPAGLVGDYSASGCISSPSFDRNSRCCQRDGAKRCVTRWARSAKPSHFSASSKSGSCRSCSTRGLPVRSNWRRWSDTRSLWSCALAPFDLGLSSPTLSKDVIVSFVAKRDDNGLVPGTLMKFRTSAVISCASLAPDPSCRKQFDKIPKLTNGKLFLASLR